MTSTSVGVLSLTCVSARACVRVSTPPTGNVIGDLNKRRGAIIDSTNHNDEVVILAEVPLNNMFGYAMILRANTQVGWVLEHLQIHANT